MKRFVQGSRGDAREPNSVWIRQFSFASIANRGAGPVDAREPENPRGNRRIQAMKRGTYGNLRTCNFRKSVVLARASTAHLQPQQMVVAKGLDTLPVAVRIGIDRQGLKDTFAKAD